MAHASTVAPPKGHSWMLFVDGENFTIRGQELADKKSIVLTEGRYYSKNTFLWILGFDAHQRCADGHLTLSPNTISSFGVLPYDFTKYLSFGDLNKIRGV